MELFSSVYPNPRIYRLAILASYVISVVEEKGEVPVGVGLAEPHSLQHLSNRQRVRLAKKLERQFTHC
jgi:hypothetical protein